MKKHSVIYTNEKLAPRLVRKTLLLLQGFLVAVGKPFYQIFSFLTIIFAGIFYYLQLIVKKRKVKTHLSNLFTTHRSKLIYLRQRLYLIPKITNFAFRKAPLLVLSCWQILFKLSLSISRLFFSLIHNSFDNLAKLTKKVLLRISLHLTEIHIPTPRIKITRFKPLSTLVLITFLSFFYTGHQFWFYILKDLPDPTELTNRNIDISTKIYDRNGILLYQIYKNKNRTPVKLSDIPIQVRLATLAAEDADFYNHSGISIKGIVRAGIKDIKSKELTGGSTITQQLVKNALLSSEKTLVRKLREVTLAFGVESTYSKDVILEMYLNEVSYGGTAYGIQEASRTYFDKDVTQLSLAEAALLAGLPKSPTLYSPYGSKPDMAAQRQQEVLHLMYDNGFITENQEKEALNQNLNFTEKRTDIKAPHFVMYVRQLLEDEYGKEVVEQGGLEVTTTLDIAIQNLAENVITNEVEKLKSLHVGNAAALVLNPKTGEILAMVGSKDYFNLKEDGNVNVTTALRQPGSSIKIVNYAYALSHNFTPASLILDTPTSFKVDGQPPYSPRNYDGKYVGNLTLRSAFAQSRNIPAVKVLASYGVANMLDEGKKMGITTWAEPSHYGLSLTLGGGEVKLIDLANAYSTIANYGKRPDIHPVLRITNYQGKVLADNSCTTGYPKTSPFSNATATQSGNQDTICDQDQVVDPRVAFILTDILKDNAARAPAFGYNSMLVVPRHPEVAVKTGTSNDLRDNLTVGYNQNYLVAVWVGNNDNSPMSRVASGVTGASPIFNHIIGELLASEQSADWIVPEGLVQLPICSITGSLACENCFTRREWFLVDNQPQMVCNPEYIKKQQEIEENEKIVSNQEQAVNQ